MKNLAFVIFLIFICPKFAGADSPEEGKVTRPFLVDDLKDYYGDEDFVTIATGSRKPIYKAPAVATVITAEEIKKIGARDLDDILETVAGIHVAPSALNRLDSIFSIRGIHTGFNPQVLLLINGIPFPSLYTGGHPILFRLPVAAIARVEVIRGPGSAIYGADAFAGVVNIITKDSEDIGGSEVGGRYGSFDTHDVWALHGGSYGPWSMAFALEWQKSEGDQSRIVKSDFQSSLDKEFGTRASLAPGPLHTNYDVVDAHLEIKRGDWRLRNWYWSQNDAGQGAGGVQALDDYGTQNEDLYMSDLTWSLDRVSKYLDLSSNLNYLYHSSKTKFRLLPPGAIVPIGNDGNVNFSSPVKVVEFPNGLIGNPEGIDQQIGVDVVAYYSGFLDHRWRVGVGYRFQETNTSERKNFGPGVEVGNLTDVSKTPFVFMPDSTRDLWYFSLQDEWQFAKDWEFTGGIRFDKYSDFGSTLNPRFALVWTALHNLTNKILYGRAFRAPSFSELYAINNPVVLGSTNLSPEIVDTLELSTNYRPTFNLQTNFTFFGYKAKNLIEFVPDLDNASSSAKNNRNQEGYGLEVEVSWYATDELHLVSNYALQHSTDEKTGKRIADAPRQQFYLRADWNVYSSWGLHPQVTWVADRPRENMDFRSKLPNYTLVDMVIRREGIGGHWDLAVAGRNLLNENSKEPSEGQIPGDYPLEGRSFWAEVQYRF